MGCGITQHTQEDPVMHLIQEQLNVLFETEDAYRNIRRLWRQFSAIHERPEYAPAQQMKVDITRMKRDHTATWDILMMAGFEENTQTNNLLIWNKNKWYELNLIRVKLDEWLILNDEYDVALYGFSDSEQHAMYHCADDLSNCSYLMAFKTILFQIYQENAVIDSLHNGGFPATAIKVVLSYFKQSGYAVNSTQLDIDKAVNMCLDHFLHLKSIHDTDDEFAVIFSALNGICRSPNCAILKRHIQRRYTNTEHDTASYHNDPYDKPRQDIMDKIHCYYMHSYHSGYRLTTHEKAMLEQHAADIKSNDEDPLSMNKKMLKYYEICHQKQNTINNIIALETKHNYSRFGGRLLYNINVNDANESAKNSRQKPNVSEHLLINPSFPVYSFGFQHFYKAPFNDDPYAKKQAANIKAKWKTLKQELLQNKYSILTLPMFHSEYHKARMHFVSQTGKKYVATHSHDTNAGRKGIYETITRNGQMIFRPKYTSNVSTMSCWHFLALLVYCNYDQLQRYLTETYRKMTEEESKQDVFRKHSEFYQLGLHLKEAVTIYGKRCRENEVNTFYHGIDRKMIFPQFFTDRIAVYGPVSTTKSRAIAIKFAGPLGIIIEFDDKPSRYQSSAHTGGGHYAASSILTDRETFHFECDWISDFAAERECLFIQASADLVIMNITDMNGTEYGTIFDALRLLHNTMNGKVVSNDRTAESLMDRIVADRLASNNASLGFQRFESLDDYATALIERWFSTYAATEIIIDWKFCDSHGFTWKAVDCLGSLFPNVQHIRYRRFDWSYISFLMDNIYNHFNSEKHVQCVYIEESNVDLIKETAIKTQNRFSSIKASVLAENNNKKINKKSVLIVKKT